MDSLFIASSLSLSEDSDGPGNNEQQPGENRRHHHDGQCPTASSARTPRRVLPERRSRPTSAPLVENGLQSTRDEEIASAMHTDRLH